MNYCFSDITGLYVLMTLLLVLLSVNEVYMKLADKSCSVLENTLKQTKQTKTQFFYAEQKQATAAAFPSVF